MVGIQAQVLLSPSTDVLVGWAVDVLSGTGGEGSSGSLVLTGRGTRDAWRDAGSFHEKRRKRCPD